MNSPLQLVEDHLRAQGARKVNGNWTCPAHDDSTPSLSVEETEDGKVLLHCHGGCSTEDVVRSLGLEMRDLFPSTGTRLLQHCSPNRTDEPRRDIHYDYKDEYGKVLYRVTRSVTKGGKKTFRQSSPDGQGGWRTSSGVMKGVRRVLYGFPELLAADLDRPVFLVEGEKDADRLRSLGLVATTNPSGAGKWESCEKNGDGQFSEPLRGRNVVILPDNDAIGRRHAEDVAQRLSGIAASIKILHLPGLPEKGDVSDWLEAGRTRDGLEALAEETPEWIPTASPPNHLVEIEVGGHRPACDLWDDAARALAEANQPPSVFVRSGVLVRVRLDEKSRPIIESVDEAQMRGRLGRIARFVKRTKSGEDTRSRHVSPPKEVVQDVLSRGEWPGLPGLHGVVEAPVLRPDGSILDKRGYDPATGLYYSPEPGLRVPRVSTEPTKKDVELARDRLLETIEDFPFVNDASRAAALALILSPLLRPAVPGPVPMLLIDSPQQGTGKSKLANLASVIATGREAEMTTAPDTPGEWRKKITALLVAGRPIIVFDNVEGILSSEHLASVLTARTFQDRDLGKTKMTPILPQEAVWCATGNNLTLGGDLGRRCYLCRMDARMAEPWRREGSSFRHPNLIGWVLQHRGELVAAVLTLGRAWFAANRPAAQAKEIGFPGWSQVLGGILGLAGVGGFLENTDELYAAADMESGEWETFLTAWRERMPGPVPASRISEAVEKDSEFRDALPADLLEAFSKDPKGTFPRRLGWALRKRIGRRYGATGLHVVQPKDGPGKVKVWAVAVNDGSAGGSSTPGVLGVLGVFSTVPHTENWNGYTEVPGEGVRKNPKNPQNPLVDRSLDPEVDPDEVGF